MGFMRVTVEYSFWDYKRNGDIVKELQVEPIMQFTDKYQLQWKNRIQQMDQHRIQKEMLLNCPHH